jgi:hypothetical protein
MDLTYKIVRRILRDREVGFSRNRNFEAYEDEKVKRALRIARHLQSVERDLIAAGGNEVNLQAVEQSGDQIVVRLAYQSGKGHRVSYLSTMEWLLLLESPTVSAVLHRLLDESSEETQNRIPTQPLEDE